MPLTIVMWCVAALLGIALSAGAMARSPKATLLVYPACLVVTSIALAAALVDLLALANAASSITLPIGLPWLGARFRLDALSAFFLGRSEEHTSELQSHVNLV